MKFENMLGEIFTEFVGLMLMKTQSNVTDKAEILSLRSENLGLTYIKRSLYEYKAYKSCCFPKNYRSLMMSCDGIFVLCVLDCCSLTLTGR